MPWTQDVINHLLGDDLSFLNRYCSALTRERLAGADPGLVREVLKRLADALPAAAHTTPGWGDPPFCIVAIGKPSFQDRGGVTTVIGKPYIGLGWDEQKGLFLWADDISAGLSGGDNRDWCAWRTNKAGTGPRLRFSQPLTHEGVPQDPLAAGQPLDQMLAHLSALITHKGPPEDMADIIDQARVDIDELDGFEGQPCEALDVIYPRLTARASGNAREEGMDLGPGGATSHPATSKSTRTRGSVSRGTFGEDTAVIQPAGPSTALSLDVRSFRLDKVVKVDASPDPSLRAPFLDLRFARAGADSSDARKGPGIYGISFGRLDTERHLIYVGSYCGTKDDSFDGDVADARWWKHASTLTMRGRSVSIARKTAAWAGSLADRDAFRALANNHAVLKKKGCDAGLNRVLFAHSHWGMLSDAKPEDIQSLFQIVYLRITRVDAQGSAGIDISRLLRSILWAENALIRELRPACNYQITWGSARTDVTTECFKTAAQTILKPLLTSET